MNVSDNTIQAIRECNTKCFYMNRYLDTACDTLAIDFVCNQAEGFIHEYMAHAYPALADKLNSKCLGAFNIKTYYGATPAGDWQWDNLVEMMDGIVAESLEVQNMFMGAIKIAQENGDYLVAVELYDLLKEVNEQVAQAILIRDKAQLYQNDYASFDHDFPTFFTLNK